MTAWDFASGVFNQSVSISAQDTVPTGIFFRADGLKMYHIGDINNKVYEYDLSVSFDISTLSLNQSLSTNPADVDVFFKPDGLRMFILDSGFGIVEYNLSTAWDISTAVIGNFKNLPEDSSRQDIFFREDGLIMYMIGSGSSTEGSSDRVYRYNLSTAWDVTTAVFNQSFHVVENLPTGIFFKTDGLRMFVTGAEDNSFGSDSTIWEYPLTIPWDISSTTSPIQTDITSIDFTPRGSFIQSNGAKFYHVGLENDSVYEYILAPLQTVDKDFTVDANLVINREIEFSIDAKIPSKKTFTIDGLIPISLAIGTILDAFIQKENIKEFIMDGIPKGLDLSKIFTIDAIPFDTPARLFSVNALLKELDKTIDFIVDSNIIEANQTIFSINVKLKGSINKDFTIEGRIVNAPTQSFIIDAIISPTREIEFSIDGTTNTPIPESILNVESVIGNSSGLQS